VPICAQKRGVSAGVEDDDTVKVLQYLPNCRAKRKNPPRISADGFRAKQLTLRKTPPFNGPVKRGAKYSERWWTAGLLEEFSTDQLSAN
jgi:hypothetical protein